MIVVVSVPSDASEEFFNGLAEVSGALAYDLRTRLAPGAWGVLKAFADREQAFTLEGHLVASGFIAVTLEPELVYEPERRIVAVRELAPCEVEGVEGFELVLGSQRMKIPFRALLLITRGEVRLGEEQRSPRAPAMGLAAAMSGSVDAVVFRERPSSGGGAVAAADLHFATVSWVARLDTKVTDLRAYGPAATAQALDRAVHWLAGCSDARIDLSHRISSLASYGERPHARGSLPPPSSRPSGVAASSAPASGTSPPLAGARASARPARLEPAFSRFDHYSRLVAEAERAWRIGHAHAAEPPGGSR